MTTRTTSAGLAWAPVLWIGGLHLGALLAFVPGYFSWSGLALCFLLHWMTGGIGICMTYHRLLTHRSFATHPKWLEYLLTAVGCCASEGGPIHWVADHRRHHAHADDELDVHSPKRGFAWAHALWWMVPDSTFPHSPEYLEKWAPDLNRDPVHRWLDRYHYVFAIALGVGLYVLGGMPWLVWGGFVRSVLLLHSTWLVNSATHLWGYRAFETHDSSTNLWWVAVLAYGEGWHNNHHAFPTSARHGLRWWEVDVTYAVIRVLSWVKLAGAIRVAGATATAPAARGGKRRAGAVRGLASSPQDVGAEGTPAEGEPERSKRTRSVLP